MKPGDRGDQVERLQQALRDAADPLPQYGVDGHFGGETSAALRAYCEREQLAWSGGPVPREVLVALGLASGVTVPPVSSSVRVYDLRHTQTDPHPKSLKGSNGKTVRRNPSRITGIVLHQAAVKFSPPRSNPTEEGLVNRAKKVACHAMAFDGAVALAADLLWHIYHADGYNSTTLGLEVDGLYPGVIGGKVQGDKSPTVLTEGTIAAAREGVRLLVEEGAKIGVTVRYILGHRQADSWRRDDPGEELWRKVVLEYAVPVLGLRTRPAESIPDPQGDPTRHGKPIPIDWDPAGVGRY